MLYFLYKNGQITAITPTHQNPQKGKDDQYLYPIKIEAHSN